MISILKTDTTWQPEQVNEVKYILRANKTFTVPSRDFVDYDTGINLDFSDDCNIVFKLYNNDSLALRDNILEFSNYLADKSSIVRVENYTNDSIIVRETQYFLSFETIPKSHGNQQIVQDEPAQAEPVQVEPVKEEPVQVEPFQVETAQVEPVQVETAQVEPAQVEPVQVEPTQVEPVKEEPKQVEPVQVEPVQVEPEQVEPVQVEPAQDTTQVEPVQVEQKKRKYVKRKP